MSNDLTGTWRKSSYSGNNGACVEIAFFSGGVAARDSKDPHGPTLTFHHTWHTFLNDIKTGRYDT